MKLTLLLIPLIFLSSCTVDWNDGEDNGFDKKQECAENRDNMLKEAVDFHTEWMNRTGDSYDLKIEEIFYSKNYNTCIYQLSIYKDTGIDNNDGLGGKILLNKYIYDYFSKKEIISTVTKNTEDGKAKKDAFDIKIKELKGE